MKTRITDLLRTDWPIVQAPMAGVSSPSLAAAVSNAGGLGSIALGASTPEAADKAIQEVRSQTNKTFNVNLFVHHTPAPDPARDRAWLELMAPLFRALNAEAPTELRQIYPSFQDWPEMLELLLDLKPPVISFHFGLPDASVIDVLKATGAVLLASATTPDEARAIEAAGIDAIVAQGHEAGGHQGRFSPDPHGDPVGTMALVPQIVAAVRLPVIAAGGIMNGRGIAAALALGAEGVQLGTAYVACPETLANPAYRQMLASDRAVKTKLTPIFSGRPARAIANEFTMQMHAHADAVAAYPLAYDAGKALASAAAASGFDEYAAMWAGQGAGLSRGVPAGELTRTLMAETEEALRRLASLAG
ncbi:MAG: NAD(P)H-dependent flavin oxidoreductase [Geminicoccaceae bacterium]